MSATIIAKSYIGRPRSISSSSDRVDPAAPACAPCAIHRRGRQASGGTSKAPRRFGPPPGHRRAVMITRETLASRLRDYLQHRISRAALVDWAENAMMDEEF